MKNRIMLIEDDPDDEFLTLTALNDAKITNAIDITRDGEEALDFLFCRGKYSDRNKMELPQLILLDLKLPKVDGLEVLKEIRSNPLTKRIPVVVMTSSREENDLVAGYDSGANSFIVKPMDPVLFAKTVANIGLYWLIVNTPSL